MQVKIFGGTQAGHLEACINDWLTKNPDIAIKHITHCEVAEVAQTFPGCTTMSVWYDIETAKQARSLHMLPPVMDGPDSDWTVETKSYGPPPIRDLSADSTNQGGEAQSLSIDEIPLGE